MKDSSMVAAEASAEVEKKSSQKVQKQFHGNFMIYLKKSKVVFFLFVLHETVKALKLFKALFVASKFQLKSVKNFWSIIHGI